MEEKDFEAKLSADLPRGKGRERKNTSGESSVYARWLGLDEMTGDVWGAEGGLFLGRRGERLLGWKDDRHILTIAGSRAGKGRVADYP